MIYEQALEYIHTRNMFAKKDGLNNISALCNALDNPQDRLKIIHIAGTNGKGSAAAYISSALKAAGYKTGTCISPFVTVFNERIRINGEYISDAALADYTTKIAELAMPVTEFEFVTALAFLYFAEQNCDYVVLEAGMGGKYDATNIINSNAASVITLIDFDHMKYLGGTIEEIAEHKCGIIKKDSKVFSYSPQNGAALKVIKNACNDNNADLTIAGKVRDIVYKAGATRFYYEGEYWDISMCGAYQPFNAALAIETLKGLGIKKEYIRLGLLQAFQPCRFQIVRTNPYLIYDGAHNKSGCTALAESIKIYLKNKPVIVFGMSDDKQYCKCIELLAPLADKFIVAEFENSRAINAEILKREAEKYCSDVMCVSSAADLQLDLIKCDTVVCGSLYLVSEAAKYAGI